MKTLQRISKTLKNQLYTTYKSINGDIVTFWDCRNTFVYSKTGIYITISRYNEVTKSRYELSVDKVFSTLQSAKKHIEKKLK